MLGIYFVLNTIQVNNFLFTWYKLDLYSSICEINEDSDLMIKGKWGSQDSTRSSWTYVKLTDYFWYCCILKIRATVRHSPNLSVLSAGLRGGLCCWALLFSLHSQWLEVRAKRVTCGPPPQDKALLLHHRKRRWHHVVHTSPQTSLSFWQLSGGEGPADAEN